jgi:hypothetical protein
MSLCTSKSYFTEIISELLAGINENNIASCKWIFWVLGGCWNFVDKASFDRLVNLPGMSEPSNVLELFRFVWLRQCRPSDLYSDNIKIEDRLGCFSREEKDANLAMMVEVCNNFADKLMGKFESPKEIRLLQTEFSRDVSNLLIFRSRAFLQGQMLRLCRNTVFLFPSLMPILISKLLDNRSEKILSSDSNDVKYAYSVFLCEILERLIRHSDQSAGAVLAEVIRKLEDNIASECEFRVVKPILAVLRVLLKKPVGRSLRENVIGAMKNDFMMFLGNCKATARENQELRAWYIGAFFPAVNEPAYSGVLRFCEGIGEGEEGKVAVLRVFLDKMRNGGPDFKKRCLMHSERLWNGGWRPKVLNDVIQLLK